MKIKILCFAIVMWTAVAGFSQDSTGEQMFLNKRLEYFKKQPLFVEVLSFDASKLDTSKVEETRQRVEILNNNLISVMKYFWDLNDTIFFVQKLAIPSLLQQFPDAVFLQVEDITQTMKDLNLVVPSAKISIDDVKSAFVNTDTSLLYMIDQLRFLRYNIINGITINTDVLTGKMILIDKEKTHNYRWNNFAVALKKNYKRSVLEVDRTTILQAVVAKDEKYLYVDRGWLINAADGSIIQLEDIIESE